MATIVSTALVVLGTNTNDTITTSNGGAVGQLIYGGLGNDIYFIDTFYDYAVFTDTAEDQVVEAANGGIDTVYVRLGRFGGDIGGTSYGLGANIEHLRIDAFGIALITADGNELNNEISITQQEPSNYFSLNGFAGNDKLSGGIGDDTLDGGAGQDTMIGGNGGDTYIVNMSTDVIIETADGTGFDAVNASANYTLGNYVDWLTLTGSLNINGTGNNLNNSITGNSGNNILSGLGGIDFLYAGAGHDTLLGGDGNDEMFGEAGNDSLNGGNGDDQLVGGDDNDKLFGGAGNDRLNAGNGNNTMDGGAGDDQYIDILATDIVTDTGGGIDLVFAFEQLIGDLGAGIENLQLGGGITTGRGNALNNHLIGNPDDNFLYGLAGNDLLQGLLGNDVLVGDAGNDTLDGGSGNDLLIGGAGNDEYLLDSVNDAVNETLNGGIDTVFSSANINNGTTENVEKITLVGTASLFAYGNSGPNTMTGNFGNNILIGGNGNDTFYGGGGADTFEGGAGNDTYYIDSADDGVLEFGPSADIDIVFSSVGFNLIATAGRLEIENLTLTGTDNIVGFGNDKNNKIIGNAGSNTLNGQLGNDTMIGGLGDDLYWVDAVGDVVTELANQGLDIIQTSLNTYSIAGLAHIENLTFTGAGAFVGTGNAANNTLIGQGFNDTLIGGAGNDTFFGGAGDDSMVGGTGNDTYYMEGNDIIVEGVNGGFDGIVNITSSTSLSGALANIEFASLLSTAVSGTDLTGNAFNNSLNGSANDNTLTGLGGNDTLFGAGGNDTLLGGDGNDTLDGGTGIDRMEGGKGDDVYYLDSASDNVIELANEGTDTIIVNDISIDLLFRANVENLTLTGTANLTSWGNGLNNTITGNAGNDTLIGDPGNDRLFGGIGNDTLDGGTGADTMTGGVGNDTYRVDNIADVVTEIASSGIDTIESTISFNLTTKGVHVENLTLVNSDNINGTGNTLDNRITGNGGNNSINGGAGNDTLSGGDGADTLTGGAGNDVFIFNNLGVETVTDYTYGIDFIRLSIAGLTFTGAGNTLTANQFDLSTGVIDGDTRIIYDQTSGNLFYDADGSGGVSTAVQIADFTNGLALSSISFFSD